ncbi:MAG: SDR family NAD(P)-dependent oxidoreductase [Syntrophomonadaceae bacterium]|jgi:NAD(P)-dependent dehydrogenase (short-subunit alcohol dehydrogenase family)|nr:SDR family oxidoreductase [Bacillota bacterium]NLP22991.1 SDR family oxidoreductase [Syntrophomonadaceae bacterium]
MSNISVDLTGQVAAVTGAGNGIGKACALALASSGAQIALLDISASAMEQTQQEIADLGGSSTAYVCDVSKVAEIKQSYAAIAQNYGNLDIAVNSAGVNVQQRGEDVTEEAWDKVLGINAKGSFFCCQAAGRIMMQQKKGKIINIGSAMSVVGYVKRSAYCASKGAVAQFTKVLAGEWASYNITVNTVCPTFIYTPFTEPMFRDQEFKEDVERRILLHRIGDVDDVTGTVLYLASSAADFVTGSMVMVDGGWTAW